MSDNPLVHISSHPLVKHKLSILRDVKTKHKLFRELIEEITIMLVYESLLNTPVSPVDVQTPVGISQGETLAELDIAFVPILRAGLGMLDGALNILPSARVWHLGLYRDETSLRPVHYYNKLGNYQVSKISLCIILDPMLATGGSINAAIDLLKQKGAKKIKVLSIIAAPEGVRNVSQSHPDVEIYLGALDSHLNEHGYIIPGLGDAGDRQYGTDH